MGRRDECHKAVARCPLISTDAPEHAWLKYLFSSLPVSLSLSPLSLSSVSVSLPLCLSITLCFSLQYPTMFTHIVHTVKVFNTLLLCIISRVKSLYNINLMLISLFMVIDLGAKAQHYPYIITITVYLTKIHQYFSRHI